MRVGNHQIGKIHGTADEACPECGNDDLFWAKSLVHHSTLADSNTSWWPNQSSSLEKTGVDVLECSRCGHQFRATFYDRPSGFEDEEEDGPAE